jgi:MerR family transcriptional regulator, thiopeptide resistance regulator
MWVEMMEAAGMDEPARCRWHREFERRATEEHHQFLRFLGIAEMEIKKIRSWSRKIDSGD